MSAVIDPSDAEISGIVRRTKVVAVVGMKDEASPDAPAFSVPARMLSRGVRVIPVNPTIRAALGVPALGSLAELTEKVDVVQVFRRSDAIPGVADAILALPAAMRPAVVWLQSGIRHDASAARLAAEGMTVVQDRCYAVELARA